MNTEKFGEAAKRRLDLSIHATRATLICGRALTAYDRVVRCVQRRSALFARRASHRIDVNAAILAMVRDRADWLAEPESWAPTTSSPWLVLGSLAEHLFARFPMPRFMVSAWFDREPASRRWYKHLGEGGSIRTAGVPMNITRAMAHRFLNAPHHATAIGALRWAQVRALGGTNELARALIDTRLGRVLENEEFWETVVRYLVNQSELRPGQVRPIVDFVQWAKFESRHIPDLALEGRTLLAVRALSSPWAPAPVTRPIVAWPPAPLRDILIEERGRMYTINELCTSRDLVAEGSDMRHCVASYVRACVSGRSSIWSMKLDTALGPRRVLTIEVDVAARRIRQAKRRFNAPPDAVERRILTHWAAREGLTVPDAFRP
jgi:hypothetical protein